MRSQHQLRNLPSRTTSRAGTAALALAIVFALAVPALAQNTVPPTARQAAADPAFAARLARQIPAQPANKSRALVRPRSVSPQDQILYDNGPYNGTTDAWTVNFGFSVSDSFTVASGSNIDSLHFVYWNASTSDLLTTVDLSIGSTSFGGTPQTLTGVTNTFLGTNQDGYNLYQADYSFTNIPWSGAGYVTLSNACTASGCSISNPIYWDENSGAGCTSQGCPSTAYESNLGSIPSESFSLGGNNCPWCPPPYECVQDRGGLKVIHTFADSESSPSSGLAIDPVGKVFGTTGSGGDNGLGLAYRLAPRGQDWIFSSLYSFLGGANGQNPLPEIIGPEGALYGAADGGIQSCGSSRNQYCGVIYKLRLSPAACPNALCSWTEDVIYKFAGDPDGWSPNGNLVFDQAGNLYGTTVSGGVYGYGTVFELTPSSSGWTEKIIYSFTGGSDGETPSSLLVGHDGNLYGTAADIFFQLAPSGGGWTLRVLAAVGYGIYSHSLVQDSSGNLYAIANDTLQGYFGPIPIAYIAKLSYGTWGLAIIANSETIHWVDYGYDLFYDLAIDAADQLYTSEGAMEHSIYIEYYGGIYKVDPQRSWHENQLVAFDGDNFRDLEVDASGKLYGTTGTCGNSNGTVWQLTPQQ